MYESGLILLFLAFLVAYLAARARLESARAILWHELRRRRDLDPDAFARIFPHGSDHFVTLVTKGNRAADREFPGT